MANSPLDGSRGAHGDTIPTLHPGARPGEIIAFGTYPHTAGGADSTTIRWRVLQKSGSELLLLSEYLLDCRPYHGEYANTNWRNCDLRQWLNDDFYNAAFSAAEKGLIKISRCTDNGTGNPDTEDCVFLLSVAEVQALTDTRDGKTRRRTVGTEFAKASKPNGCQLYVYDKKVVNDYVSENAEMKGCSWWWLRTQLHESAARAVFVGPRSSIRSYSRVNLACYGVRPALRLNMPCSEEAYCAEI